MGKYILKLAVICYILNIIFVQNILALTLEEYIETALKKSSEAQDLADKDILTLLELQSAQHAYEVVFSPNSSYATNKDGDSYQIGLEGSKKTSLGSTFYGAVDTTRTNYGQSEYSSGASIGIRQSLFRRFGYDYNTFALFNAEQRKKIAQIEIEDTKKRIILQALDKYYRVALSRAQIKIYQNALERAKHNYESAVAKQQAGLVSKIDAHRAKLTLLSAQKSLQDSQKNYKDAISSAYLFINIQENEDKFESEIRKLDYIFQSENLKNIIYRTPEWQIILFNEETLQRKIFNANRDLLPDIKVDFRYQFYGNDEEFSNSTNLNHQKWELSFGSDYSFDDFDEKASLQRLQIEKNKLLRDKSKLEQSLSKEIEDKQNNFLNISQNLEIQKLKEEESQNSLQIAQIRYERGLAANLDIMDAENNLLNSQISYINALVSYNVALFDLAYRLNLLDYNFAMKVLE